MSIKDEIKARVEEGRLIKLSCLMQSAPERREIYMTPTVYSAVVGPWANTALDRLCGQARGRLEQFVRGDEIVGRMPPSKNVKTVIALLEPAEDNVWEFRIARLRIFGRFAAQDIFVATNWRARQDFEDPATKKNDERKWRDARVMCKTEWINLLPAYEALSGKTLHDYISNSRIPV
jgi:hypothetical protein